MSSTAGQSLAGSISAQRRERASQREAARHAPELEAIVEGKQVSAAEALRAFEAAKRATREAERAAAVERALAKAGVTRAPPPGPPATDEQQRQLEEAIERHRAAAARLTAAMSNVHTGGFSELARTLPATPPPNNAPTPPTPQPQQPTAPSTSTAAPPPPPTGIANRNPTTYAEAAKSLQSLLKAADEAAADAAAAEAAADAAAAEKAARLEGNDISDADAPSASKPRRRSSLAQKIGRFFSSVGGSSSSSAPPIHPWKECLICLELLGTEGVHGKSEGGTVQALGCMDAFCKPCIATHLHTQKRNGHEPSCPICKRVVPEEEMEECGPPMRLPEAPKAKRPGEGSTAPGSQMGAVAEEEEEVEVVVAHQWGGAEADDPASHLYQPQQQRRESTRQRITSAAVTAAAIVTHAPALLRKSPEHLAAAARRQRQQRSQQVDDDDEDMMFLGDGTVVNRAGQRIQFIG